MRPPLVILGARQPAEDPPQHPSERMTGSDGDARWERVELPGRAGTSGANPTVSNRRSGYLIKPNAGTAPVPDAIHTLDAEAN